MTLIHFKFDATPRGSSALSPWRHNPLNLPLLSPRPSPWKSQLAVGVTPGVPSCSILPSLHKENCKKFGVRMAEAVCLTKRSCKPCVQQWKYLHFRRHVPNCSIVEKGTVFWARFEHVIYSHSTQFCTTLPVKHQMRNATPWSVQAQC